MKQRFHELMLSPVTTVVLFLLAAAMLATSTVGGTRAALNFYSETYTSRVQMYDIGVTLMENGDRISWRDYGSQADGTWVEHTGALLENMLPSGGKAKTGKAYTEELSVRNSGTIDEYVRVNVYRYWVNRDGDKVREADPALIKLNFINSSDWEIDEEASTRERTVLYYTHLLPSGAETVPFTDTLTIDENALDFEENGLKFQIEVEVNAVQTHSGDDAIRSAWGRQAETGGGALGLE